MTAIDLRKEMMELINNEDDSSLKGLYQLIKAYKHQKQLDRMIAEGEEDIKEGRTYTQSEVQKMIESWVKE